MAALLLGTTGCRQSSARATQTRLQEPGGRAAGAQQEQRVYRHSVVPGGVRSASELRQAAAGDPVVARHYEDVPIDSLSAEPASRSFFAHVSYRKNGEVFWTRQKVLIPRGEPLLTSATGPVVRSRCGNRISTAAREPIPEPDFEPAEGDLEQWEVLPRPVRQSAPAGPPGPASAGERRSDHAGARQPSNAIALTHAPAAGGLSHWTASGAGVLGSVPAQSAKDVHPPGQDLSLGESTWIAPLWPYSGSFYVDVDGTGELLLLDQTGLSAPPSASSDPLAALIQVARDPQQPDPRGTVATPWIRSVEISSASAALIDPGSSQQLTIPRREAVATDLAPSMGQPAFQPVLVPEPSPFLLLASGAWTLTALLRRRDCNRKKARPSN